MTDQEGGIATNDGRLSQPIDVIPNHNKLLELDSAKVSEWYRFLDQLYTMGMKLKAKIHYFLLELCLSYVKLRT